MSLKLSPQLDADALAAFALYDAYLESHRHYFPESCIRVIEDERWYGGYDSMSPHDSKLRKLEFYSNEKGKNLRLNLEKEHMNLSIEITYENVMKSKLGSLPSFDEIFEWRYEQFLHYDPYEDYRISETKMFRHDIEWTNGLVWSVYAENIIVEWIEVVE